MAAPVAFKGTLTQNAVLNTLYNMIIGQEVFSKNIAVKGTLADKFRIDGTLYGDTKLFISSLLPTYSNTFFLNLAFNSGTRKGIWIIGTVIQRNKVTVNKYFCVLSKYNFKNRYVSLLISIF